MYCTSASKVSQVKVPTKTLTLLYCYPALRQHRKRISRFPQKYWAGFLHHLTLHTEHLPRKQNKTYAPLEIAAARVRKRCGCRKSCSAPCALWRRTPPAALAAACGRAFAHAAGGEHIIFPASGRRRHFYAEALRNFPPALVCGLSAPIHTCGRDAVLLAGGAKAGAA